MIGLRPDVAIYRCTNMGTEGSKPSFAAVSANACVLASDTPNLVQCLWPVPLTLMLMLMLMLMQASNTADACNPRNCSPLTETSRIKISLTPNYHAPHRFDDWC